MRPHTLLHLAILVCPLVGCRPEVPQRVLAWQTCIECSDGELDSIKALGPNRQLRALLREGLANGPPPAVRNEMRARFAASYDLVYRAPDATERDRYVALYLDGFVQTWRERSARALKAIGESGRAIDSALAGDSIALPPSHGAFGSSR
jgi:hypothetical protein